MSCTEECEWSVVNGEFLILTTYNNDPTVQVSDTTGDAIYSAAGSTKILTNKLRNMPSLICFFAAIH